jgi:hypothetical protein
MSAATIATAMIDLLAIAFSLPFIITTWENPARSFRRNLRVARLRPNKKPAGVNRRAVS